MPIFELDAGRPAPLQPMQPAAGTFDADSSSVVTEHLGSLLGEPLFPVARREPGSTDAPHLLAVDAAGQPVVVEVVPVLDSATLTRSLRFAGAAARMSSVDLARAYHAGPDDFAADLVAFRETVPVAKAHAAARHGGARLLLVCSEVAENVVDAVEFLRGPGRAIEVLQLGVVRGPDGRRFVEVSPLVANLPVRRPVEPSPMRIVPAAVTSGAPGAGAHPDAPSRREQLAGATAPAGTFPSVLPVPVGGGTADGEPTDATPGGGPVAPLTSVPRSRDETATGPLPTVPEPAPRAPVVPVPEPPAEPGPVEAPTDSAATAEGPADAVALETGEPDDEDDDVEPVGEVPAVIARVDGDADHPEHAEHAGDGEVVQAEGGEVADAVAGDLTEDEVDDLADDEAAVVDDVAVDADALADDDLADDEVDDADAVAPDDEAADGEAPDEDDDEAAEPVGEVPADTDPVPVVAPAPPAAPAAVATDPEPLPELTALAVRLGGAATLVWTRLRRGQRFEATLRENGLLELSDGALHADPDAAATAVVDAESSVDGWRAWHVGDGGPSLAEARAVDAPL